MTRRRKRIVKRHSRETIDGETFDTTFRLLMQSAASYFSQQGYLKPKIRIHECWMEKYQESRNPIKGLDPLENISELSPFENVHLYVRLESDGREEAFFGNFYLNEEGNLVSDGFDDEETDIDPKDIADEKRLSDKAIQALREYRKVIWEAVEFLVNVVLRAMLRFQPRN